MSNVAIIYYVVLYIICFRHCQSFWQSWLKGCRRINKFLDALFSRLGFFIANRPLVFLILGTIIPLFLMVGFTKLYAIDRVEKLYIPQSSQSLKDLDRGHEHFGLKFKAEEFIIRKKNNQWALEKDVFEAALQLHNHILSIPGLEDICYKNALNVCMSTTPLEIFQFNNSKMVNIEETLNKAYQDNLGILSNGRQAKMSYYDYFSYFEYNGNISRADAIRNVYLIIFPEDDQLISKQKEWEEKYIAYMEKMRIELDSKGLLLLYTAGRSLDDSVSESSFSDLKLVSIAFMLMIFFCNVTLARFRNHVIGHFLLGIGGILALTFGIGSAFGFAMLTGNPYVAFVGVLPFLVLGVGIDNIFIITDCLDRQDPTIKGPERIAKAMGHVGATISMTTLTDLVAFLVSMVTDFPAIKYFCLYAAFCITICYVLVITLFIAMLTYDVRRIESGRRDFIPCLKWKGRNEEPWTESAQSLSNKVSYMLNSCYTSFSYLIVGVLRECANLVPRASGLFIYIVGLGFLKKKVKKTVFCTKLFLCHTY